MDLQKLERHYEKVFQKELSPLKFEQMILYWKSNGIINENIKVLWDININTDYKIEHR